MYDTTINVEYAHNKMKVFLTNKGIRGKGNHKIIKAKNPCTRGHIKRAHIIANNHH